MQTIIILPGLTTAGDNISLPANAPPVSALQGGILIQVGEYTVGSDEAPTDLTVVDSSPSAGEIALVDESTVVLGDNTDTFNLLQLNVIESEQYLQPS